ncbi:MAG: hypothetical protein H7Y31_18325 [Chitinophagaceae bacterium]|nr:hypothetical protein [Chitinophagaceae bacterium]
MTYHQHICYLIARKMAKSTNEIEEREINELISGDNELAGSLETITRLWNAPGQRNKKETTEAFRLLSERLNLFARN